MTMRTLLIFKLLKKYNIKPSKRLGQNFLIDESILNKIIEAADLSSNDIVLEIGPGLGVLTVELTKKVGKIFGNQAKTRVDDFNGAKRSCAKNMRQTTTDEFTGDFGSILCFIPTPKIW